MFFEHSPLYIKSASTFPPTRKHTLYLGMLLYCVPKSLHNLIQNRKLTQVNVCICIDISNVYICVYMYIHISFHDNLILGIFNFSV